MNQLYLPSDLEAEIPPHHLARVMNDAVERLSDDIFDCAYPGGGRPAYHPKMLTKVIIYAYTQQVCSSRQIAKAVRENIPFMWLAGRQTPDFRTINRFRSERMKDVLEKVFAAVLELLVAEGYVKLEHYKKLLPEITTLGENGRGCPKQSHLLLGQPLVVYICAKTSPAICSVSSRSARVCCTESIQASNRLGASATPRSSRPRNMAANRSGSDRWAVR